MYSGNDISNKVEILRDKTTKKAQLRIDVSGKWNLYAGASVENIDFSEPILTGNFPGTYPLNVDTAKRSYFLLVTDNAKAILSEKHLPMEGGYNFRDLGGINTNDGRYVRWGKLFRSDDFAKLSEADLKYLASIPIQNIVDFRAENEIEQAPDILPTSDTTRLELPINPGNIMSNIMNMDEMLKNADSLMINMNEAFVLDPKIIATYRYFFELLQDEKNAPLIYHCSAGKDRTGMATALILFSLGVNKSTIMDDYLLSNTYLADKYEACIKQYPAAESLFKVKKEFLQAGIDKINEHYGCVENFLQNQLSVNLEKMKALYLY